MGNSDDSNSEKAECGLDEELEGEDSSDNKNESKEHKGEEEEMREDRENHRVKDDSRIGGYGPFKPESKRK